jgi:hypothetical protein
MICDLNSGVSRLQKSLRQINERWAATKENWNDQVSREFEEKFLQPIVPRIKLTLAAVHTMAELFHDAENECEDRFSV